MLTPAPRGEGAALPPPPLACLAENSVAYSRQKATSRSSALRTYVVMVVVVEGKV